MRVSVVDPLSCDELHFHVLMKITHIGVSSPQAKTVIGLVFFFFFLMPHIKLPKNPYTLLEVFYDIFQN